MKTNNIKRPRRYLRSRITRKLILDTAQDVFLQEGYAKTTIAKISAQANVGYGTVYSHFKGKDDILSKVIDNVLDEFYTLLETPFKPKNVLEAQQIFYHMMLTSFRLSEQHRSIMKVYQEALGLSEQIAAHWQGFKQQFIESCMRAFISSQERGLAKDFDPLIGAKAYILLVERFIWEVVSERERNLEHLASVLNEIFFYGMFKK